VFPSLAQGGVGRTRLVSIFRGNFRTRNRLTTSASPSSAAYQFYGLGTANRTRLNVSLREGSLASFAYILHLEFPEPGMYSFMPALGRACNPVHSKTPAQSPTRAALG